VCERCDRRAAEIGFREIQYNAFARVRANVNARASLYLSLSICVRIIHIYGGQSDISAGVASAKPIKVQMHGDASGMPSSTLTGKL